MKLASAFNTKLSVFALFLVMRADFDADISLPLKMRVGDCGEWSN